MLNIKDVHKNNLRLISENNIRKGVIFENNKTHKQETIEYYHKLYGWLLTTAGDKQKLPQEVKCALEDWRIVSFDERI